MYSILHYSINSSQLHYRPATPPWLCERVPNLKGFFVIARFVSGDRILKIPRRHGRANSMSAVRAARMGRRIMGRLQQRSGQQRPNACKRSARTYENAPEADLRGADVLWVDQGYSGGRNR